MDEIALLVKRQELRISNLETALYGMWTLLKDLQPPDTQAQIDAMMKQHFKAGERLGGFKSANFIIE